jgi:hypothetical protein
VYFVSSENGRKRKPPASVRTIDGKTPERDTVTDDDYAEAVAAQDATLFAAGNERKILGRIRSRLVMGARDAGRKYYFDEERGIVRRRENQETGS